MEEFITASGLLKLSFCRYTKACSTATEIYAALSNPKRDSVTLELVGCITRELQTLANYQAQIPHLKSTLTQYRNSAPAIVPISALPSEILARIFELVHGSWVYSTRFKTNDRGINGSTYAISPMPPVVLSHVCTHWRRTALGLPLLWSHDHITTPQLQDPSFSRLMDRGKIFANRIGLLDTSLHIDVTPRVVPHILVNAIDLGQHYTDTGKGLQRLQLDNWTDQAAFCSVLGSSLTNIPPNVLKQLVLVNHPVEGAGILVNDARVKKRDRCLRSITVLHLIDVRIPWRSSAYSGLSDLRLLASGIHMGFGISAAQLMTVLSSSPELRVFHFNYQIAFEGETLSDTTRVPLKELEELNIRRIPNGHNRILELLSPGSKPMSLSISADRNNNSISGCNFLSVPVSAFLERANVVELYVESPAEYKIFPFSSLLGGPLTRLHVLGLKRFRLDEMINTRPTDPKQRRANQLDLLHLHDCIIYPEALQAFASICTIRTLNLCKCMLIKHNGRFAVQLGRWNSNKFVNMAPNIKFLDPMKLCRVGEWKYWEVSVHANG